MKNFFKLNKLKKSIILGFSFLISVLFITLGSIYLMKDTKFSSDYKNGSRLVLNYTKNSNNDLKEEEIKNNNKVLVDRLKYLLPESNYKTIINPDNSVIIEATNVVSDVKLKELENIIKNKKNYYIFDTTTTKYVDLKKDINNKKINGLISIDSVNNDSATATINNLSSFSHIQSDRKYMILTDVGKFINIIENDFALKKELGDNLLFDFFFVNPETLNGDDSSKTPILRTEKDGGKLDSSDFLFSINEGSDYKSNSITLKNEYLKTDDKETKFLLEEAQNSLSNYNISIQSKEFYNATNGREAYLITLIALGVIAGLVSIFLMVNYGLLGALILIPLSLLVFISFLFITIFQGDYDPLNLFAIFIITFFALAINIPFLQRIKKEVKDGLNVDKAIYKSNSLTFFSSLATVSITLVGTSIAFLFAEEALKHFFSMLVLGFSAAAILMFLLPRGIAKFISKFEILESNKKTLGIWRDKKENNLLDQKNTSDPKVSKFENIKVLSFSKIIFIVFGALITTSLITFSVMVGLGGSPTSGFNNSNLNSNKTSIIIKDMDDEGLTLDEVEEVEKEFLAQGFTDYSIEKNLVNHENKKYEFVAYVHNLDYGKYNNFVNKISTDQNVSIYKYALEDSDTNQKMLNAMYMGIAFLITTLSLFLMKYNLATFISVFSSTTIMFLSIFAIFNLSFIPIASMIGTIVFFGLVINLLNNMLIINRIKEKSKNRNLNDLVNDKEKINELVNEASKESIKNLLITNGILLIILLISTLLVGTINWFVSVPLIIFTLLSILISIFVVPKIYAYLEFIFLHRKIKRGNSDYWDIEIVKEQVFPGINEIK